MPPLVKANNTVTENIAQIARELFKTFYSPLPATFATEPTVTEITPIKDLEITLEEVKRKVFSASKWKASGRDGLLKTVWQQL